jgi:hypothetical protein
MSSTLPIQQCAAGHVPAVAYDQAVAQAAGTGQAPVIVVQAPAPPKQYGALLLAATVGGGLVVAMLLAVSVVAIAVGIGAISCTVGWLVIRSLLNGTKGGN